MSPRTIDQLEQELHQDDHAQPGGPDLLAIRAAGTRRRHLTALGTGGGAIASMVVLGLVLSGTFGAGGRTVDEPSPATHPHKLSDLAQRALTQVAGATQVSGSQVVLPQPATAETSLPGPDVEVVGTPIDTGAHYYNGVTGYRPTDFPHWLYAGVAHIEQTDLAEDGAYPVGSTEMGILVDSGPAYLGCVANGDGCGPTLLTRGKAGWEHQWGMGTDDFLKDGSHMEVFLNDDYSTGVPGKLVLAGLPGADVARVDLLTTDGRTVPGHVESGTVVDGATMMWGTVEGGLAAVIAYDADGAVIEDHELKPCSGGVDCEVR